MIWSPKIFFGRKWRLGDRIFPALLSSLLSLSLSLSPLSLSSLSPLSLLSISPVSPLSLSLSLSLSLHALPSFSLSFTPAHFFFNDIRSYRDSVMSGCKGLSDCFAFFPSSLSYIVPDIIFVFRGGENPGWYLSGSSSSKGSSFSIQNLHFTDLFDPLADCTTKEA